MDHKKAQDTQLLARPTVKWVHLDRFSAAEAARELVYKNIPAHADELVTKRYQVFNVSSIIP